MMAPTPGDPVERAVADLNARYGLTVRVPHNTLTPLDRKRLADEDEEYAQWDR